MTRMHPLRRLAATAAVLGVTAFGGVALAAPALADTSDAVSYPVLDRNVAGEVVLPDGVRVGDLMSLKHLADGMSIRSPLPDGSVRFVIGRVQLTMPAQAAQAVQTVIANLLSGQGYDVAFTKAGVLVMGLPSADPDSRF